MFGEPGDGALEGVAVQIGHAGQADGVESIGRRRCGGRRDVGDDAAGDGDSGVGGPAAGQQRVAEEQGLVQWTGFRVIVLCIVSNRCAPKRFSGRSAMRANSVFTHARLATMAPDRPGLGVVEDGMIAQSGGRIVYAGPMRPVEAETVVDCAGRWITPGLIDCHTHLVYAGDRAAEFEARLDGASYEEIARGGGGIMASVTATRAADIEALLAGSIARLRALLAEGVTTVEIKSGYGLSEAAEVKMLRAIRQLAGTEEADVAATFLGAHALPPEFRDDREGYLTLLCERLIPLVAAEGLADAVDGFCEGIAFRGDEIARYFTAAQRHGLAVKLHADQLSDLGGAALAARFGARSADHLEYADEAGVAAMAAAGTVAVLLPGAFYTLRETRVPPVAAMRRYGVRMAVATDSNPGTSPLCSLLLAINMAATMFRLTVNECLLGVTRHAAAALGRADIGTLEAGKKCHLAIWDIARPAELVYRIGYNPLWRRVWSAA
jgi:imidazolonepropionase